MVTNATSLLIAENQAIEMAYLYPVSAKMAIIVYKTNEGAYVRTKDEPVPKDATVVCITQRWDSDTIQIRRKRGQSDFITLFDKPAIAG
jgi:hypothetical protein